MTEYCFTGYVFTDYENQTWYACTHKKKKGIYYLVKHFSVNNAVRENKMNYKGER